MSRSMLYKILTAGDGGVGKTTLLRRYVEGTFKEDTIMTMGVNFFRKELFIRNDIIMLQLWDFGGQEQFRFMLEKYVVGAKGILIMFDLTRYLSIKNIEDWIKLCTKGNPHLVKLLIGTKLDLTDKISVSDDEALEIKEKYEFEAYIKISSKTGENVNETFEYLAEKLLALDL
ncbi:MAG: Rab family GTPase [Promethearchaeota archaeon]